MKGEQLKRTDEGRRKGFVDRIHVEFKKKKKELIVWFKHTGLQIFICPWWLRG